MQFFLFIGMAMALFVLASFAGTIALSKITGIELAQLQNSKAWDLSNPGYLTYMRGMILLQFLFLWTIPSLLFAYFSDRKPFAYLGLQNTGRSIYWVYGILVVLVAFPFVEYIGYLNQKLLGDGGTWAKEMEETAARQTRFLLKEKSLAELVKNLVFIALFAGIGEELFFRGILQRMLIRTTRNAWAGIVLAAILFSAFHFQFYGFLPRLFLGVLLGAIYWFSGSLWIAMAVHFLYDAAGVIAISLNPKMLASPDQPLIPSEMQLLLSAMVSLALTFVLLYQMQKKSVARFEAVYADDFPKQKDDFSF